MIPLEEYHGGGRAATIEPFKRNLPEWEMTLAMHLGYGVTPAFRGRRLWDGPSSRRLLRRWTRFFKHHRAALTGDVVHIVRPEDEEMDVILHVAPEAEERALLLLVNTGSVPLPIPLAAHSLPLYYSGLRAAACATEFELTSFDDHMEPRRLASWLLPLDTAGRVDSSSVEVPWEGRTLPPKRATYFVFQAEERCTADGREGQRMDS